MNLLLENELNVALRTVFAKLNLDDKYAFVGTVNMDYRSMFLHYECGALIIRDPEVEKMHDDFIDALNKSKEVSKKEWEHRPIYQWLIAFILNMIAPFF